MRNMQLRFLPAFLVVSGMLLLPVLMAEEAESPAKESPPSESAEASKAISDKPSRTVSQTNEAQTSQTGNKQPSKVSVAEQEPLEDQPEVGLESETIEAGIEEVASPSQEDAEAEEEISLTENGVYEVTVSGEYAALPAGTKVGEDVGDTNLISIALDQVPVLDVVSMFSRLSGANIIVSPLGDQTNLCVTANLKNVHWKTALNLALGSVNLSMIEDPSGILMVVTTEMYKQKLQQIEDTKPLITRTFSPRYLNTVDLVEQIKLLHMLSPRGRIITSQGKDQALANLKSSSLPTDIIQNPSITTEIIVTDIKEYVDKVAGLIKRLDRREPQVCIEARIIDVVSRNSRKLGFDWEMLDRFGVSAGLTDLKWKITDTRTTDNRATKGDNQYDIRSNQDDIDLAYDIDGTAIPIERYNSEGDVEGYEPARNITDSIRTGREITSLKTDDILKSRTEEKVGTAVMSVSEFRLFLSALKRNANAELISHPVIVVGNRVEAKIHIGERYPTITLTKQAGSPDQGTTDSYSEEVEWNDLGLTLWVIPEIDCKSDMVRITVNPQMATWVKDIVTKLGSVYPVISKRQVSTRVNVPNGHTVAIGGLIDNRKIKNETRVPFLGDIPLLGLLFRHTEDVIEKHDLIVLLTTTILDDQEPLAGLELMAQQVVNRLEKQPFRPKMSVNTNELPSLIIGEQKANTFGREEDSGQAADAVSGENADKSGATPESSADSSESSASEPPPRQVE